MVKPTQTPAVNADKEVLFGSEPVLSENLRIGEVEKERGFTNAPLPNQGDTLPIAEQRQNLAHFVLATKEIGPVADRTTVEEGV